MSNRTNATTTPSADMLLSPEELAVASGLFIPTVVLLIGTALYAWWEVKSIKGDMPIQGTTESAKWYFRRWIRDIFWGSTMYAVTAITGQTYSFCKFQKSLESMLLSAILYAEIICVAAIVNVCGSFLYHGAIKRPSGQELEDNF